MSVTRSTLIGGPAYAAMSSKNIQFNKTVKLNVPTSWTDVESALYGKMDKVYTDLVLKLSGEPTYYDTAQISLMFPYIGAVIGAQYPGSTDIPCALNSINGDTFTLTSAIIGKMPDIFLGVDKVALSGLEIWGVIANSADASAASSYFARAIGNAFANPAVAGTAVLGRQEFTAAWGSVAGFTSFQAQEGWQISHELELQPVKVQGRTRAFRLASYRAMAKCIPVGPTAAQIDAALYAQGTGALGGYRASTNAANLVITGAASMTVTIGNAGMVSEGYVFGAVELRNGEIGFVSNLIVGAGGAPGQAALTLA